MADGLLNFYDQPDQDPLPSGEQVDELTPLNDKPFDQEPIKLTSDEVAQIWREIDQAVKYQRSAFYPVYKAANDLYEGKHWPDGKHGHYWDGYLTANIISNTLKSLVEAVAFSEPDFTIHPLSPRGEQVQDVAKSILLYYWREAHVQQQLKRITWDAKTYGVGIGIVGWLYKTETIQLDTGRMETLPPGVTADHAKQAEQAGLLKPGETAKDFVPYDDVIEDRFQVVRINPMDFLVPYGATSVINDWPWCARLNRVPLVKIKDDPRFRHSKRKHSTILSTADLQGTTELSEPYDSYQSYLSDEVLKLDDERRPPDTKFVELVEYYERNRRIHVILCRQDRTKYLLAEKWPWQSKKYPFVSLHNTHLPDQFYGKSVPYEMWSVQIALNHSLSQTMEHSRQFNRMYQCPKGALDDKAKNGLADGQPGTVIEYDHTIAGENPIQPIQHLQLQPEIYTTMEQAEKMAELISGLSQYQFHNPPSKRLTATEANHIQNAGGVLFQSDAQAFVDLCKDTATHCLEWAQQYAGYIQNLPIFDEQGKAVAWANFTGDQIRGDWLVEIWPESTQPPDAASDLQQNQETLRILLGASQAAQQFGGQLPRTLAIVFREGLRIIGARNIDELLPLPPESPQGQPWYNPAPPAQAPPGTPIPGQQALPPGTPLPPSPNLQGLIQPPPGNQ